MKILAFLIAIIVSINLISQCNDTTLDNCPNMISPPALSCLGDQPPMLRNHLGPNIDRIPSDNLFVYENPSEEIITQNEASGLRRKFIARVPVLKRKGKVIDTTIVFNGNDTLINLGNNTWLHATNSNQATRYKQRNTKKGNPSWRYFVKNYYYNTTKNSREDESRNNDKLTMNCWSPDASSSEMLDRQNKAFQADQVFGAYWSEGADKPGYQSHFTICNDDMKCKDIISDDTLSGYFPRTPNNLKGIACITNNTLEVIELQVIIVDIKTGTILRDHTDKLTISPSKSSSFNFDIHDGEGFGFINISDHSKPKFLASPDIDILEIIPPLTGERSPDNICRYGIEEPILFQDFFPGDKFGDKRDTNGDLRK